MEQFTAPAAFTNRCPPAVCCAVLGACLGSAEKGVPPAGPERPGKLARPGLRALKGVVVVRVAPAPLDPPARPDRRARIRP